MSGPFRTFQKAFCSFACPWTVKLLDATEGKKTWCPLLVPQSSGSRCFMLTRSQSQCATFESHPECIRSNIVQFLHTYSAFLWLRLYLLFMPHIHFVLPLVSLISGYFHHLSLCCNFTAISFSSTSDNVWVTDNKKKKIYILKLSNGPQQNAVIYSLLLFM